jgi:hypothetical protein
MESAHRPTFPASALSALPVIWLEGVDCRPSNMGTGMSFGSTCANPTSSPLGELRLRSLAVAVQISQVRVGKPSDHLPRLFWVANLLDSFRFSYFLNEAGLSDLRLTLEQGISDSLSYKFVGTDHATYIYIRSLYRHVSVRELHIAVLSSFRAKIVSPCKSILCSIGYSRSELPN